MTAKVSRAPHDVTRLDIHTDQPFDTFVKAFEEAARLPLDDDSEFVPMEQRGAGHLDK